MTPLLTMVPRSQPVQDGVQTMKFYGIGKSRDITRGNDPISMRSPIVERKKFVHVIAAAKGIRLMR